MEDLLKTIAPSMKIAAVSVSATGVLLLAIGTYLGLIKGTEAMPLATVTSSREAVIPPIDASAPSETETATFSLG